jgi:hypothetical protein
MAAFESHNPKMGQCTHDVEKQLFEAQSSEESLGKPKPLWFRILNWGVEEGGIEPVPVEKRRDTRYVNLFTVWFTALLCLLP